VAEEANAGQVCRHSGALSVHVVMAYAEAVSDFSSPAPFRVELLQGFTGGRNSRSECRYS
jgi:hypothetical protein